MNEIMWIIAIIIGVSLFWCFILKVKKNIDFQRNTGGWKEIEKNAWHGDLNDFRVFYKNINQKKIPGVYIHKNLTNGKCYVGQSNNIFERVNREITGKADNLGCKLLYNDYLKGHEFKIILIFKKKEYPNLNKMERAYINMYDSCNKGYNRTYGNDELTGETIYK